MQLKLRESQTLDQVLSFCISRILCRRPRTLEEASCRLPVRMQKELRAVRVSQRIAELHYYSPISHD